MRHQIMDAVECCPIIAAVKNDQGLEQVLTLEQRVVFLLYGDVVSLPGLVERLHQAGKLAVVHADLIAGLGGKDVAVDYIRTAAKADGIISTRPAFIRRGRELGLFTVLRFFVFDSLSLGNVAASAAATQPDVVEILPGIMPKIVRRVARDLRCPLICGGLIMDKADVVEALSAGAVAVSTTSETVWSL